MYFPYLIRAASAAGSSAPLCRSAGAQIVESDEIPSNLIGGTDEGNPVGIR